MKPFKLKKKVKETLETQGDHEGDLQLQFKFYGIV